MGGRTPSRRPEDGSPSEGERLQKILAAAGFGSRRACEEFLRAGRVAVNRQVAELGARADLSRDLVTLDGERIAPERLRYWMVHKPTGMLTTLRDSEGRPTVVELLPPGQVRLFPVGRLDGETSGLVLMTNDGAMTHRLLHPSLGSEREYRVR
ncbi:MAG: pseudouridine synthase, partial [Myxococcota bacterium]